MAHENAPPSRGKSYTKQYKPNSSGGKMKSNFPPDDRPGEKNMGKRKGNSSSMNRDKY